MSGCHKPLTDPFQDSGGETLALCVHGVPVKFGCNHCWLNSSKNHLNYHTETINVLTEKFENRIKELERIVNECAKVLREKRLSPFKCPVCEGKSLSEIRIVETVSGRNKILIECHGCDGTGIVWG